MLFRSPAFPRCTSVTGVHLVEARHINKSLSALGNVTMALSRRDRTRHVPYRDSKLTYLLQPALTLHSRVIFFVTASPARRHAAETTNTLQFGRRCRKIELGPAKSLAELVPRKEQFKSESRR
jgi:hypothetical protein